MHRRQVLIAGLTAPLAASVGAGFARPSRAGSPAGATSASRFDDATVPALARGLAARPYREPAGELPPALERIDYDLYRDIRFEPARALWRDRGVPFQAQFFHRGFLFPRRVEIHEVVDGTAAPVVYEPAMFSFGAAPAPGQDDLGFAGFRLHAPLNQASYFDEVCSFLGASYFRAVAQGQVYGLSARGLALATGAAEGEEFPWFRAFWLERPQPGAGQVVVHALLDSPSVAGAFRFVVIPGQQTVVDVDSRLYPRVELADTGIAPLTSMFQFDASDRVGIDDYREAVHDSDGLALFDGAGGQAWRPLHNPAELQESRFADRRPRGFGLMQRKRDFGDYGDTEARYDQRPSLWVEPVGDWGRGAVHLFEIPTADEYHDNIVAFWRPEQPLAAGREHRYRYRLHWCDRHQWVPRLATVERTRIGAGPDGSRLVVIDLAGSALDGLPTGDPLQADAGDARPRVDVQSSAGRVANAVAHASPQAGGWRLAFELHPGDADVVELRAQLRAAGGAPLSETWLYRWTR